MSWVQRKSFFSMLLGTVKLWRGREPRVYQHIDYPLNPGGSLIITSFEDPDGIDGVKAWRFDIEAAQRGLQLMAEKYPHHYADFMAENDDATTGDVFLQLS